MDSPLPSRRRKSARERREQQRRADSRLLGKVLKAAMSLDHRGSKPTIALRLLADQLRAPLSPMPSTPTPVAPTMASSLYSAPSMASMYAAPTTPTPMAPSMASMYTDPQTIPTMVPSMFVVPPEPAAPFVPEMQASQPMATAELIVPSMPVEPTVTSGGASGSVLADEPEFQVILQAVADYVAVADDSDVLDAIESGNEAALLGLRLAIETALGLGVGSLTDHMDLVNAAAQDILGPQD